MRQPTYTETLFGISLVFFGGYLAAFNYELLGRDEICNLDLSITHEGKCEVTTNNDTSFRLVVKSGGNRETVTVQVPISVQIKAIGNDFLSSEVLPRSASASGGRRYFSNLNYGEFKIPNNEDVEIAIKAGRGVEKLVLFQAKLLKNPTNIYVYLFGIVFLAILFLSIYFRKRIFLQKYGKPLPYILFFLVGLLTLTWNV